MSRILSSKASLLLSPLVFSAGVAAARLSPILIGIVLTAFLGEGLSDFVSFLLISNILISFSSQGAQSLIISSEDKNNTTEYSGFSFFVLVILYLLFATADFIYFNLYSFFESLLVLCYSSGYLGINLYCAVLNRNKENVKAGLCWLFTAAVVFVASFLVVIFSESYLVFLTTYSMLWFFWCLYVLKDVIEVKVFKILSVLKINKKSFAMLSMFGCIPMLGMYLLKVDYDSGASESQMLGFAVGFQMFSMSLFLPGILGALVVPRLVELLSKSKEVGFRWKSLPLLFYVLLSSSLAVLGSVFSFDIFSLYVDAPLIEQIDLLRSFLWVAVLGAVNAYFIQIVMAKRQYESLFMSSILWLLVIVFVGSVYAPAPIYLSLGSAYVASTFYLLITSRRVV
ncbi:hypothetical protein [Neptunomonas japonica]|uniref:Polysaccharide biosynthesis protein n=1 Tax=Neptunomonas japonica JAMM 1380 TaxID=1441457 RepID=A0A7R6SUU6_9GAMM|nr:hypothetical protein [Neptunomonas japonica]BBB28711.1 hypothetical protein NEJAP_0754 [Neptunomonas japonica JAMM 1380]